ncbi:NAD-dependent epimerase/dehydratase family protein [Actinocatenispora sera]|uniref:dTDP-glucose 4,6-dehydratase n=1 Tax=Actinocatenispora sera TaxID=390989 RepID=A0A810KUY5_9ACTN|nr:NAD(P)-dependent oxidoreductase [Actinocatenispora sera]BCJ26282.1 dTDP-glucose 4,6-dehydratase [Actinocatenispora sera]
MRVFVAGATGVVGRQLLPLLAEVGHEPIGMARSAAADDRVRQLGGRPVRADALDADAVAQAVRITAPDAIVNMLTAIPAKVDSRHLARDFAATNRLRTEGTRNLLAAARRAGVPRVIAQGLAYAYEPGDGVANEDSPLWAKPPSQFVPVLDALRDLERQTTAAGGLVLRLGHLYGPGSTFAADGMFTRQAAAGKLPIVGGGTATYSFLHGADAASAIVAALDRPVRGVLNVVDDDPAPVHEWLPALARIVGGPAPKRVPAGLARLAAGAWGVAFLTRLRGADNARARLSLDWRPRYASWRDGFAAELTRTADVSA